MSEQTGVFEWADASVNCQLGCEYGCKYCYASSMAIRFKRISSGVEWGKTAPRDPGQLPRGKRVMFPTTHDITPGNVNMISDIAERLISRDNNILFVTKGDVDAVEVLADSMDLIGARSRVEFRITIGTLQDWRREYWEPDAPIILSRLATLHMLYQRGFKTSVSCEPMLFQWDSQVAAHAERLLPFITESLWYGYMNLAATRLRLNLTDEAYSDAMLMASTLVKPANAGILESYLPDDPRIRYKDTLSNALGGKGCKCLRANG